MTAIARVVHIITKLELGGAQQNTLYTVSHLDRRRFMPYLITGEEGILDEEARGIGAPFFQIKQLIREVRPRKDVIALLKLTLLLRRIRSESPPLPVIVHTHSSKAGILGRWAAFFARCERIVHTYHGFGFTDYQSMPVRKIFVWAERITRPVTHKFICVSHNNIQKGIKEKVLKAEDTRLIRSGVDIGEFSSEGRDKGAIRASLGVPADAPLAGMVACFKPQKSPVDFVDIAAKVSEEIPGAFFIVAGDGALRPEIEARISDLEMGDKVKLLGWRRDAPDLMAAMDVLALPSLWEGLPRVIPQAWATGLPVVATAVDGSAEAIQEGENGFLFEPRDIGTAARKIAALLKNEQLRQRVIAEGKRSVAEFDIDLMVRRQERLYREIIE